MDKQTNLQMDKCTDGQMDSLVEGKMELLQVDRQTEKGRNRLRDGLIDRLNNWFDRLTGGETD
jgi:hypothetical protein